MSESTEVSFNLLPFLKDIFLYFMGNVLILKDLDCAPFTHSLTLFYSAFVATENSF